jgi:hypothetical protein
MIHTQFAASTTLWRSAAALALLSLLPASATAQALIGLLGPEDTAIAIDLDATFVGPMNNGRYPAAENPPKAIDGLTNTKYLNFGGAGSGFIVTPAVPSVVESFQITTANDAPGRDPSSWALYGFNGALTTTDSGPSPAINQTGLAEAWTLIDSGGVTLPGDPAINNDQRGVLGPVVNVNSGAVAYEHFKMIFPTMKTPGSIMQFAEIQFYGDDAATPAQALLAPANPIIAVDETPTPAGWAGSSFPGNETPAHGIDQFLNAMGQASTKYLNFGEERSGIIITNSGGPVDVNFMRLTTANDAVDRDPTSYELYGTNDPITTEQNSNSNGTEVWTLLSSGPLSLPDARFTNDEFIVINSPAAYTSYRLIFPTVKNAAAANSMQIADIQFYTAIPEPSSWALVVAAGLAVTAGLRLKSQKRQGSIERSPRSG